MAQYHDPAITDSDEFLDDACEGFSLLIQALSDALGRRSLRGIERAIEDMQDALEEIRERYEELVEAEEKDDGDPE